jgi:hypothetical protein
MCHPGRTAIFDFVSRVFAPAPGSAAQTRVGNSNFTSPFAKPQGCATRVGPQSSTSVSRVFAPAPGSAAQTRVGNSNFTTPFAKPQGRATRVGPQSSTSVSRVFAPAPGSAAQTRVANSNFTSPFAKPQGCATRVGRTLAAPRLRQSLAALGSGYGLNERIKANAVAGKTKFRIPHFHLPPGHSCAQDPHVMLDVPDQDVGTGSG